ncbi:MAG: hypothetical protein M1820_010468 [Bogoriella megaspora]|nr:MAG: hypothetical protein M1820_010468 [Bogoriella megaspora]
MAFRNWFAIRFLAVFSIVFGLLLAYGHTHFYRDPGSIFFNRDYAFERQYSNYRQRQAREFLKRYTSESNGTIPQFKDDHTGHLSASKAKANATICVNFVTVRRKGTQLVDDAIGSALAGLSHEEREDVHFTVFFANTEPTLHPTFQQSWLRQIVDSVYWYPAGSSERAKLKMLEGEGDWTTKMRTVKALRDADSITGLSPRDWLYLRLFNQERSTGWNSRRVGDNHEFWISLSLALIVLGVALALRHTVPTLRPFLDNSTLAVACIVVIPSLVVLFFQAGKASLLPPRPGIVEQNFGCCSQALLYPREQISGLIKSLHEQEAGQYDLMINEYAKTEALSRLSLYPAQVRHLGVESTRDTDPAEAQAVWSAAFETLSSETLKADHERMVEEIYRAPRYET